jgi:hypothetical protein
VILGVDVLLWRRTLKMKSVNARDDEDLTYFFKVWDRKDGNKS